MKYLRRLFTLCLFLFAGMLPFQSRSVAAQKETLLLGPGDLVHMLVFDTPEMEQRARVTDGGDLPFSFVGNVPVSGLTPEEAQERIEKQLVTLGIMRHPQVLLRVESYATQNASVMGQVLKPGVYEIDTRRSVVDVLALAGGLTDLADRHITIQRAKSGEKVDYYFANAAGSALTEDPMVFPGDTVVVPRAPVVYVLGDVLRPGGYPVNTNNSRITVLEAIALAGYANHTATVSKSKLLRQTPDGITEIDLHVNEMQRGKKDDVALLPDDIVYVPFSFMRNVTINSSGILASAASAAIYAH